VKYSTTSGGPYSTLSAGLPSTSRFHSGLNYGTTYYYVVSAANSVYESPVTAELAATPDSAPLSEAESATPAFVIIPASGEDPALARLTTATSVAGHGYQLQTSTDLAPGSWLNVGEPVFGDGSPIVFETPYDLAEPRRFYRILISR
jgi:cellulose 1,4-beta-cellobiosidase